MTDLAAAAPDFNAAIEALGKLPPVQQRWLDRNRAALQLAFDQALSGALNEGRELEPFQTEAAAKALRRMILRQSRPTARLGRNPMTGSPVSLRPVKLFKRPCCSRYPGTYPFCNPDC